MSGVPFAVHLAARDHGQMGETFPIIEEDLLTVIEARLRHLESSGRIAELQATMRDQAVKSVRQPKAVAGLGTSATPRSWLFDPSIVVENDVTDDKGALIAARGQRVNPMAFVQLTQQLVFIDGTDKTQRDWAVARFSQMKAKIIFVNGSPFDQMKPYQRRFYFDQGGQLVSRFGIRNVPAIVSGEGQMLRIAETPVKAGGA
ncbi:MAG: type-F conjugative transfer system protein TraW [Sphingorhabdus sp.]|uniref:type-F conjugative transfer system protein TraW n=1 Tax=Sphingorhabdus sp. TaxID=1902408 RepID=UPI003C9EC148